MDDRSAAETPRGNRPTRELALRVAGMTLLPLAVLAIYLLFLWPRPTGAPPAIQLIPSLVSLALGAPFVRRLIPADAMLITKVTIFVAYFVLGLGAMYFVSQWLICAGRGVCL